MNTTFEQFKALRLVCRRFDAIVKRRVYSSHIKVFRKSDDLLSNVDQLLTLLSSKPNEQLHATTALLIANCDWLNGKSLFTPFHQMYAINVVYYDFVSPIREPFPRRVVKTTLRAFAKLKLYLPVSRFNLLNVSHVVYAVYLFSGTLLTYLRWNLGIDPPKWIISRIVKLLQRLPQLCELTLIINKCSKGFDHLVDCVAKLHNLRKLSFKFIYAHYVDINCTHAKVNSVAKIIAANPNLKHLEVLYDDIQDLALMLRHIPADRPLKLEHLRLSRSFCNSAALVPHIFSLTSIDLADSYILKELLKHSIFPPTMTFWMMDQHTIQYLDRHPRIVSLTNYGYLSYPTLLGILSRHSETLIHLGLCDWALFICFDETQNELALLQCTNLKQLALDYGSIPGRRMAVSELQMVSLTRCTHLCHVLNVNRKQRCQ